MNVKRSAVSLLAIALLATPFAVSAESDSSNYSKSGSAVIDATVLSCIRTAVATRESSLGTGVSTFNSAVSSAYTARASALASAYADGSTRADIKSKVKAAWKAFKDSIKNARNAWKKTRNDVWKTFRTNVKACKAPNDVTDVSNASGDVI